MLYQEFHPSPHVAKHIKCFWTMEQLFDGTPTIPEPILPDGCPEIVFNLASPFRRHYLDKTETQPQSFVVGQMKHFVLIEPSKKVNLFGVRFLSFGLYSLVKQPMNELTDKIESIDSIFNKQGNELEERINEASTTMERISVFEKMFEKVIAENKDDERFLRTATQIILEKSGQISVEKLARMLRINVKQLERQFNREIGITPKSFSRIIRFQKILQCLNETTVRNWADLAYSFGYFDQSHFIKDFKGFTGTSPNAFSTRKTQMTDFFIG